MLLIFLSWIYCPFKSFYYRIKKIIWKIIKVSLLQSFSIKNHKDSKDTMLTNMISPLHSWTHGSCYCLHKICIRSSQSILYLGVGRATWYLPFNWETFNWETIVTRWMLGKGNSLFFSVLTVALLTTLQHLATHM